MERRQGSRLLSPEGVVVVGHLAASLADTGEHGLADALGLLVDGLGLRSAVLRELPSGGAPAGELLAVAGDVVHAVPTGRTVTPLALGPVVEVDVAHSGRPVAVLLVQGARPTQLPVLRAAAAVLGLALSPRRAEGASGPAELALVDDAEADRDALADALHDGPVQSLVVARYAADGAVRAGDPTGSAAAARDAVQEALVSVRRTLWQLRPRAGADLAGALEELSVRLVETGGPALDVQLDPQVAAVLPEAVATTAYRLVQAVCDPRLPVRVRLDGGVLEVLGGASLDDPERWQRRSRAVGAALATAPGRLRLTLPTSPSLRPKATP